ncbi:hypothetical protein ACV3Z3_04170 [Clostridium perfringens]
MKVLVNLGANWAIQLDGWEEKYKKNEVFDKMPYGYCWANDEDTIVDYIILNKFEKSICLNINVLMKLYFYLIKLPIKLLKYDIMWSHNDKEALYFGFLKQIPFLRKALPYSISNIIWITDKNFKRYKMKRIQRYLKNLDVITILSRAQINVLEEKFQVDKNKIRFITYGLNKEIYSDKKNIIKPNIPEKFLKNFILMVGTDVHRDIELFKKISKSANCEKFIFATNSNEFLNQKYPKNVLTIKCDLFQMKWLYKNCKFVIMPLKFNYHASGCTTLIEVALQKKAIILNSVNGLEDYFIENETAIVLKDNKLESFLSAINTLNNKIYRDKIAEKAFNYVYENKVYDSKEYSNTFKIISKNQFNH